MTIHIAEWMLWFTAGFATAIALIVLAALSTKPRREREP